MGQLTVQKPFNFLKSIYDYPASIPLYPEDGVTTDWDADTLELIARGLANSRDRFHQVEAVPKEFSVGSLIDFLTRVTAPQSDWFAPLMNGRTPEPFFAIESEQVRTIFKKIILHHADAGSWVFVGRMHPAADLRFLPIELLKELDLFVSFNLGRYDLLEYSIEYVFRRDELSYCAEQIRIPRGAVSINNLIDDAKTFPNPLKLEEAINAATNLSKYLADVLPQTDEDSNDFASPSYYSIYWARSLMERCYVPISSSQLELVTQRPYPNRGQLRGDVPKGATSETPSGEHPSTTRDEESSDRGGGGRPSIAPHLEAAAKVYFSSLGWPEQQNTEALKKAAARIAEFIAPMFGSTPAVSSVEEHLRRQGYRTTHPSDWDRERIAQLFRDVPKNLIS
ncbi:MAG: hypothetical protein AAF216_00220 [Pseudomonadota bacterium]